MTTLPACLHNVQLRAGEKGSDRRPTSYLGRPCISTIQSQMGECCRVALRARHETWRRIPSRFCGIVVHIIYAALGSPQLPPPTRQRIWARMHRRWWRRSLLCARVIPTCLMRTLVEVVGLPPQKIGPLGSLRRTHSEPRTHAHTHTHARTLLIVIACKWDRRGRSGFYTSQPTDCAKANGQSNADTCTETLQRRARTSHF